MMRQEVHGLFLFQLLDICVNPEVLLQGRNRKHQPVGFIFSGAEHPQESRITCCPWREGVAGCFPCYASSRSSAPFWKVAMEQVKHPTAGAALSPMGPLARLQDTAGALHSPLQGSTAGLSSSAGQQETPATPPTAWVVQLLWEWGGCLPSLLLPKRHVSPINPEPEGLSPHSGDTEPKWLGLKVKPCLQPRIPVETRGMRVAVVGAGVSGLTATKCCLDEGLEPTCFEQSQDIGGVWRYTEHIEASRPSLYASVISNTSKEMSAFSDFPFPEDFPVFLPNAQLLDYLQRYAEHFSLREHIKLGTTVVSIRKHPDFATTGQWNVVTEAGGKQMSHVFDAVMVCSGNFSEPSLPLHSFPGIERFKGQYFHSRQYKHPDVFQGKRVLVVGMGNSGVDIAVEASRVAAKVTISTTRGSWLLSRVFEHGYPWDMVLNTRFMSLIKTNLPRPLPWWLMNYKLNQRFNHETYGLQPEKSCLVREPVLNDDLPSYILTGRITIKPGVKEFKDNSVVFHNYPEEEPIDIVVFCTGYNVSFPFLEESVIRVENKHASLYKYVFPTHLQKPTLAVLGLIKPLGGIMPVAEMQARWVSRVFKGLCQLPSQSVMEKEVNEQKKNQVRWFGLTFDEVLKTEWLVYLDTLASFIGAKPSVLGLLCTDPWLALTIFFGPCSPYQYRLGGPGRWEGARQAILTQWDRVLKPTRTRVPAASSSSFPSLLTVVGFLLLLAAVIFAFQ